MTGLLPRLSRLDTCAVSDALDSLRLPGATTGVRRLWPVERTVAGVVRTVTAGQKTADGPAAHIAAGAIDVADHGDVIVVANGGRLDVSCWGGILTRAAQLRGIAAVVIDGACRDIGEGQQLDFRDEIMAQIYDRGDPAPKRVLTFNIEVTDEGETHGPAVFERRTFKSWRRIGKITFDRAVASYNGDFVIHFNHPTWRSDQDDPATATRVQGRKIR